MLNEPLVSFIRGNLSSINYRDKNDGEVLFATDMRELYLQISDETIKISDIIILSSESERTQIISPIPKLYLILDTGNLWYWDPVNGWWMLLNQGEIQTSNVIISTIPPSVSYGVITENAMSDNWTVQLTMLEMNEEVYLSEQSYLRTAITQLAEGSIILGIYKYNNSNSLLYKVCNTDIISIQATGFIGGYVKNIIDSLLLTTEIYYFALFHNSNGTKVAGTVGTQMNNKPYVSGKISNLGDLSTISLPETLSFESEVTTRIYGGLMSQI